MEKKKIKVGQVFRVFEVTKRYYFNDSGKWFSELNNVYFGNNFGVDGYLSDSGHCHHFGIDHRNHAKQVGLLRITKVK